MKCFKSLMYQKLYFIQALENIQKKEDSIDIHIFSLNNKDKRKLIVCANSMKVVCLHQVRDAKLNKIEIDQLIYFS